MHALATFFDKIIPQKLISRLFGWLASLYIPWLTHAIIKRFIAAYQVDMNEAAQSDPTAYRSFNAFFTRPLKPDARTLEQRKSHLACPVDGKVSQIGPINNYAIIQAKGHEYSLGALIADEAIDDYRNGQFATLYLSPKDYHRIHMPTDARLLRMRYVPGNLLPVKPSTVARVNGLFAKNERVICEFATAQGPMAMILVGATIVGSIETRWAGNICPPRSQTIQSWDYDTQHITLAQCEEMGLFKLGSTVILLFGQDMIEWDQALQAGTEIRLGQTLAQWSSEATLQHSA